MAQKYLIRNNDEDVTVELEPNGDTFLARYEGTSDWKRVALSRVGDSGLYLLMVDDRPTELYLDRRRGGAIVTIGRHILDLDVAPWRSNSERRVREKGHGGDVRITAPMTGSIVEIRCVPGQVVSAGQVLLVIESMKMNNELRSPTDGAIEAVPLEPGQRIKAGDLLVAIRPADATRD